MTDVTQATLGTLAVLLRTSRERIGLTQRELAIQAGISTGAIRDLEQGRSRTPRPQSLRALIEALELSPEDTATLCRARPTNPPARSVMEDVCAGQLRIEILGPLTVRRDSHPLPIGDGLHRVVLARLAMTPGAPVSREELVDLLWESLPPPSAVNLVQTYVSRLRRILEPQRPPRSRSGVLELGPAGYQLNVDADQLDLLRYHELTAQAVAFGTGAQDALALLAEALDLWRGRVLTDIPALHDSPLATSLTEDRIDATLRHSQLSARMAQPGLGLRRLRTLARQHPLHEPLQAQLIRCLDAAGERAAALETYRRVHRRLVDELGISPGAELVGAHQSVLRRESAPPPPARPAAGRLAAVRPFQVPAPPADFTGRSAQLARLGQALAREADRPAPHVVTVCALTGMPGVGKSALAQLAAQQLRPGFPDGQLYLDLAGHTDNPVSAAEALTRFLRSVGVGTGDIPADPDERAALYRSVLSDRRVLVVLDNARDAAQVRALIPGAGGSAVLVTSRSRLAGLAGATAVELPPPTLDEALDMLAAFIGRDALAGQRAAASLVVGACGQLPIALRIVASRITSHTHWTLPMAAARLADPEHLLDRLQCGEASMREFLRGSCHGLSPAVFRAFLRLARTGPPAFSVLVVAAVLGFSIAAAEEVLGTLVTNNLVLPAGDGEFRFHELVRLSALDQSRDHRPAGPR